MTVCAAERLSSGDVELLSHHLAEEIAAQQDLLRRLTEKERLLIENDVNGLRTHLAESDPLLARLQSLTEMRMRIMGLLAARLSIPVDACTVTRVLESTGDEDRAALSAHATELREILAQVERRTRRVNVLLRHAAEMNQALLHALLGESCPLPLYRADGQKTPASGLPHFARDV